MSIQDNIKRGVLLMKVLIIGAGKLGHRLAEFMIQENIDVTIIDKNEQVLERINEHMDVLTVTANGIDIKVLREISIDSYDIMVASTDSDETNTVICSLAKQLGCMQTIARIRNPEYMEQLDFIKEKMGIDYIINPDFETAQAIEKYLLRSYEFYTDDFVSGKVQMLDFDINKTPELIDMQLKDLEGFDDLLITAISRDGTVVIPHGPTRLEHGDTIHVIGQKENIQKLSDRFGFNRAHNEVKRVMIMGGGNIGYYLADSLSKSKINVTLIEVDPKKAKDLSDKLDNVLVIQGDGTDIHLLEEEMLESMDCFVGATGFDEQNILMSLMAKQIGVKKSIAKVSRPNYEKIMDRLGIDVSINPIYIAASNILKLVRGGRVVSVSLLLGGDGEVTEIKLDENSNLIDIPLAKMKLPKGIIIGAIVRDGDVIIPNGNSILKKNDRIVVFSRTEDVSILKMFLKPQKRGILSELYSHKKSTR